MDQANFEHAMQHGACPASRRVFLHGDIDEASINSACKALFFMNDTFCMKEAQLVLSSCGGDLDEAYALHDVMQALPLGVSTLAIGKCMSAAPLLLACGKPLCRTASENTQFMLHGASLEDADGSLKGIQAIVTAAKKKMTRYANLMAHYTTEDVSHWKRLLQSERDVYFDAEQALEWGIIDQIW